MGKFSVTSVVTWASMRIALLRFAAGACCALVLIIASKAASVFHSTIVIESIPIAAVLVFHLICAAAYSHKYDERQYRVFSWSLIQCGWIFEALLLLTAVSTAIFGVDSQTPGTIDTLAGCGIPICAFSAVVLGAALIVFVICRQKNIYADYRTAILRF